LTRLDRSRNLFLHKFLGIIRGWFASNNLAYLCDGKIRNVLAVRAAVTELKNHG
jgi:hypothetical protein